jgi:peptidyl-prolyl cis-trans isomerase C
MFKKIVVKFVSEPLVQFLFFGACIYAGYAVFGEPEAEDRDTLIYVDAQRIDAFVSQWESRWQRQPTRAEIDGLVQQYVSEETLYRQAVAMGLDQDDPITRRRMAQKLEFLTSDIAMSQVPTDADLEAFYEANASDFALPAEVTFVQVFFDPDKRDDTTLADAEAALVELKEAGVPDAQQLEVGDRTMVQSYFGSATLSDIQRQMGSGFAQSVMALTPGEWSDVVLSGYGVHLVYVYDLKASTAPELSTIRDEVQNAWLLAQRDAFNEEFLRGLKERFEIVIEPLPEERLLDGEPVSAVSQGQSVTEMVPAS